MIPEGLCGYTNFSTLGESIGVEIPQKKKKKKAFLGFLITLKLEQDIEL